MHGRWPARLENWYVLRTSGSTVTIMRALFNVAHYSLSIHTPDILTNMAGPREEKDASQIALAQIRACIQASTAHHDSGSFGELQL